MPTKKKKLQKNGESKDNGRPPKWTLQINKDLIDYFYEAKRFEQVVVKRITKKDGETIEELKQMPCAYPVFFRFEREHELSIGLLSKWAAEEEEREKDDEESSRPGFLQAYKLAKAVQEDFLAQNGVAGISNPYMTGLALKNVAKWRDGNFLGSDDPNASAAAVVVYLPERNPKPA